MNGLLLEKTSATWGDTTPPIWNDMAAEFGRWIKLVCSWVVPTGADDPSPRQIEEDLDLTSRQSSA